MAIQEDVVRFIAKAVSKRCARRLFECLHGFQFIEKSHGLGALSLCTGN